MSNRTAESNRAIALAWENEKQRVSEGKGTRDWTQEQQQDILDRGKAYDENGKAFEGQHMRSAEMHPECQGDPDNIQFLTREEHLAAHGGDWRNPTNGYFDPVTRVMTDFGDGPIVPCKVIELSEPVVMIEVVSEPQPENEVKPIQPEEKKSSGTDPPKTDHAPKTQPVSRSTATVHVTEKAGGVGAFFRKAGKGIVNGAKKTVTFVVEHKEEVGEVIGGLLLIGGTIAKAISDSNSGSSGTGNTQSSSSRSYPSSYDDVDDENASDSFNSDESDDVPAEDRNYPETHASPREHIVPGHGQHYNTKEGRIWKEKDPYPRGGKHSDDE